VNNLMFSDENIETRIKYESLQGKTVKLSEQQFISIFDRG